MVINDTLRSINDRAKCCNRGGEHSATSEGCVVRDVQRYKIMNQTLYAKALKKVNEEGVNKRA